MWSPKAEDKTIKQSPVLWAPTHVRARELSPTMSDAQESAWCSAGEHPLPQVGNSKTQDRMKLNGAFAFLFPVPRHRLHLTVNIWKRWLVWEASLISVKNSIQNYSTYKQLRNGLANEQKRGIAKSDADRQSQYYFMETEMFTAGRRQISKHYQKHHIGTGNLFTQKKKLISLQT